MKTDSRDLICGIATRRLRLYLSLILPLLLLSGCEKKANGNASAAGNWPPGTILTVSPHLQSGVLRSGMTIQELIKVFGAPSRINAAGLEFSNAGIFISPGKKECSFFAPYAGRTAEGIGLGSSRDEVVKVYGEPSADLNTGPGVELLKYDGAGLKFQLTGGRVDWMDATFKD